MSDIQYTVESLAEIAETFEKFASDQIASKRLQHTAKARAACDLQATVWREAASIIRHTTIVRSPSKDGPAA